MVFLDRYAPHLGLWLACCGLPVLIATGSAHAADAFAPVGAKATLSVDYFYESAGKMAPLLADAQRIIARCGNDEACMTREVQKMGAALQGTRQMATAMSAKKDIQALSQPSAPRYQAWRPTLQKGSYLIDETAHISIPDPICASRPRHRCIGDEVHKGSGDIVLPPEAKKNPGAVAGYSAVEVDAVKLTIRWNLKVQ